MSVQCAFLMYFMYSNFFCSFKGPPVATKSCDDLHRVSVSIHHPRASSRSEGCLLTLLLTPSLLLPPRTNTPIHTTPKYRLWRGFSRSARDISLTTPSGPPRSAVSLAVMDKLTPKAQHHPVRHKASTLPYSQASGPQPVKSRHRGLLALLRRLSPRLKRTPSPERQWVKVEPRPGDRTSVASDHSFEAALQVRQAELLGYEVYTATLSAQDIPQKNDGNRGSRGGLSGLLTSLKNSKPSSKQEKHAASNGATEKKPQKDKEVTHQNSQKNSGVDNNEGHQNGAAPNPYTILRPQVR
ncbi:hypothetical protein SK128_003638 [Halocaridina rubra]|uniref:Uncharacterized protein n=1 Tax=Halocaridina rubra TaxID=373956 RepID=A0AAN9A3I3_HALRR